MTDLEQKKKAKKFAEFWKDKGYEKGQSQIFWTTLLTDIFGIENVGEFIEFEDQVHIDKSTGFIDGYIPDTKVLIEQKSIEKDLKKPIKQSDGSLLNPFQQAKKYITELPVSKHPKWVVTCNFKSFLVYDMNNPNSEPEEILLKDLKKEYYRLSFLVDSKNEHIKKEEEISFKAGELVGKLYDCFSKEYRDITNEQSSKDLNELCVRLVFCLYAEDAGLFGRKNVFHDYLSKYDDLDLMRENLIKLFRILDTKLRDRDPYLEDDLNQFPYVNGGLFSNENIEIPKFTEEIKNTLLTRASDDFDWSEISPTIFGAVFESTLNPDTRRSGGMHYTSIENIHKVIDPLFLDDIREKLNDAESYKNEKIRTEKLGGFQDYIASLDFFDPACGSGNFLTETYLCLRRLENEVLSVMSKGMMMLDIGGIIKVSIQQFYGIEINDFAVKVAKTALWIAEAQMWTETCKIISSSSNISDFLPLDSYDNITEGNALRIDWNDVLSNYNCNYIMGNPPFIGGMYMSRNQKCDMKYIFDNVKGFGEFDYVTAWYKKALDYIKKYKTRVAFVSTNSICQGEQVISFWKHLFSSYLMHIDFAYTTFVWNNESNENAKVHCIIVGFSFNISDNKKYLLYNDINNYKICKNINSYLVDADNYFVESVSKPLSNVSPMRFGSMPRDGGGFVLSSEEKNILIKKEPLTTKWIKRYIGAAEFLNNKERYCLWLVDADPSEISKCPSVLERIENVRKFRLDSKAEGTRKFANKPSLFCQIAQPDSDYIMIPKTSSGKRKYIPLGFQTKDVIASDLVFLIPNADIYEFGVLMSNVHNAWMRLLAGRLKSDYRYSKDIVYNTFPWPTTNIEQRKEIMITAQKILEARMKYSKSTLAEMYGDHMYLYPELLKAHQDNDKAVMEAYGFDWKNMTESDCVAKLMELYQKLSAN
ncbi:MAG: DNA methyltransferase [Bacilli bacterium]